MSTPGSYAKQLCMNTSQGVFNFPLNIVKFNFTPGILILSCLLVVKEMVWDSVIAWLDAPTSHPQLPNLPKFDFSSAACPCLALRPVIGNPQAMIIVKMPHFSPHLAAWCVAYTAALGWPSYVYLPTVPCDISQDASPIPACLATHPRFLKDKTCQPRTL